jgi:hypothetical protein
VYSHFFLVFLGNIAHLFYVLLSEL